MYHNYMCNITGMRQEKKKKKKKTCSSSSSNSVTEKYIYKGSLRKKTMQ
jgi:hypothetical protein